MAFSALATLVHRSPGTIVYGNQIRDNFNYLITGAAKAFVAFDGAAADISAAIIAQHNIASLVDLAAGNYVITLTTGFVLSSGYLPLMNAKPTTGLGVMVFNVDSSGLSVSNTFSTISSDVNNVVRDGTIYIAVFGALA